MAIHLATKINMALQSWPSGTVGLSVWLEQMGISRQLQRHYQTTGWLESIGYGAFKRAGDSLDWPGGLYAIQKQALMAIHVGARTALSLQGQAHYLELNAQVVQLFAPHKVNLPTWFQQHDWKLQPELCHTNFLPVRVGLIDFKSKLFTVQVSGAARALMECLYLAPKQFDIVEAYQIMEGLATLRPATVQQLLEGCRSIKVKRLFLFMAEKAGHAWVKHIDVSKIAMGHGKRSLVKGGHYVPKYEITVPRELVRL